MISANIRAFDNKEGLIEHFNLKDMLYDKVIHHTNMGLYKDWLSPHRKLLDENFKETFCYSKFFYRYLEQQIFCILNLFYIYSLI